MCNLACPRRKSAFCLGDEKSVRLQYPFIRLQPLKLHREYAANSLKPPCQRLEPSKVLLFILAFAETVKMLGCGVIRDGDVGSLRIAPMQPYGQIGSEVRQGRSANNFRQSANAVLQEEMRLRHCLPHDSVPVSNLICHQQTFAVHIGEGALRLTC